MNSKKTQILEKIIDLQGDCLEAALCEDCPFKSKCLPQFLDYKSKPSKEERFNLAMDTIVNVTLLEDTDIIYSRG